MLEMILLIVATWLLFNELAPLSLLFKARRLGTNYNNIVRQSKVKRVSLWATQAKFRGSAFSFQVLGVHFVVLDEVLLACFPATEIEAIVAHELGHCAMGHCRKRWLAVVSGAILLPRVQAWLARFEVQADAYASILCGMATVASMRRRLYQWGMNRGG